MMKVLHVSVSEAGGGAPRAALRVHQAIEQLRHDLWTSEMLVSRRTSTNESIHLLEKSQLARSFMNGTRRALDQEVWLSGTTNHVFRSPARVPTLALKRIAEIRPNVILLHWLGSRMLSVRQVGRLAAGNNPVAWRLADAWPLCGAEHYPKGESDERFVNGYRRDNRLKGEWGWDLNRRRWEQKRRHWDRPVHLVAPSAWMAEQALRSALASEWPVTIIPNPLDGNWWGGLPRDEARAKLGMSPHSPVLLYGALGGDTDHRKGADLLYSALLKVGVDHGLRRDMPLEILTFGGRPSTKRVGSHTVRSVGHLNDQGLRAHYSAADVMVVPSRIESFGQTASEAISCGTPVVAFRTGGLPDIVDDGINGRLAEPFSPQSLAEAIGWVLESPERHRRLSEAARATASRWDPVRIAKRYVALFEEMLER